VNCCTWVGCRLGARNPQIAKDGEVWANLCDSHDAALSKTIKEFNVKAVLRDWVRAGGGAKKMAARMVK
jgi:hypothetical protein